MSQEVVESPYIRNNLLRALHTMYFFQYQLAAARVRIVKNRFKKFTMWHNLYSFLWVALSTFSCLVFQEYFFNEIFHKDLLLYLSCLFGNLMQLISYTLSVFTNRFFQKENNVKVYFMLQKVDDYLGLENCTYYSNFQNRLNNFVVLEITVCFFIGYGVNACALLEKPLYTVFFAFGLFSMFMDNLLGSGMVYYLAVRVKIFNTTLKNIINSYEGNIGKKSKPATLKRFLYSLLVPNMQKSDVTREKWLEFLQQLLKSYKTITDLFSFSIFSLSFTVLIWTCIVIIADVVGYNNKLHPLPVQITVGMWAGFYYVQLFSFAVINDWFIKEIKKTKLLCIRLISCHYDGPYQETASDIINLIHYDTPIFIVYGIFVVDKKLPLEIIGVIATNSLVLIQFLL